MRDRCKRINSQIARAMMQPLIVATLPHDVRAALADLGAELCEQENRLHQIEDRLDKLEKERQP